MAALFGGIRRGLNKTNQYLSEKMGRAKATPLEEDFIAMEKRVVETEKLVDEIIASVEKFLYPNPAVRARLRASAFMSRVIRRHRDARSAQMLPEAKIGETMLARIDAFGRDEGPNSIRNALERSGEAFKMLADLHHGLEDSVIQNFIKPLGATKKDIAEIHSLRSKLESRRLDYDCRKRKKGNGDAVSEEELHQAEEKFEQSKKLTKDAMKNFIDRDVERVTALRALKDEMIDYHKQALGVLQRLSQDPLPGKRDQSSNNTPNNNNNNNSVPSASKVDNTWGDDITAYRSAAKNVVIPTASPPPPPAEPEHHLQLTTPLFYRALYDCEPGNDEPGSLPFKEGEIIKYVEDCEDDRQWFVGSVDGRSGYVPYNYVQLIEDHIAST